MRNWNNYIKGSSIPKTEVEYSNKETQNDILADGPEHILQYNIQA